MTVPALLSLAILFATGAWVLAPLFRSPRLCGSGQGETEASNELSPILYH